MSVPNSATPLPAAVRRTVCVAGQHEHDYPRNVVNQRLIRAAGYDIALCHSRGRWWQRTPSILSQYLRAAPAGDLLFVTEGSHRHMLWLKLACLRTGHRIVFDPFISLYNTEVEDRKLHAPHSPAAWFAKWRDFVSCHCADFLLFDTPEHRDYFFGRYRLRKPSAILRVGVDEAVFFPRPKLVRAPDAPLEVLFYGTYIPLQGIDVIIDAANLLRARTDIHFTLVGRGQEHARICARVEALALPNLRMLDPLPASDLAAKIARADVCLGIFDPARKASQVVPNKVVQCAAMGKPVISRRSPAMEHDFVDGESVRFVAAGDPSALAAAVEELAANELLAARLGAGARAVFEQHYAVATQTEVMRKVLAQVAP
jgi:glycosyltransferase involved in cell wall biosynthesis